MNSRTNSTEFYDMYGLCGQISRRRSTTRRGYALLLVCVFVVILLAVLGQAWRYVASVLRIEQAIDMRQQCDTGATTVLADAVQVLETRLVWNQAMSKACIRLPTNDPAIDDYRYEEFKCKTKRKDRDNKDVYYRIIFSPMTLVATDCTKWKVEVAITTSPESITLELPSNPP